VESPSVTVGATGGSCGAITAAVAINPAGGIYATDQCSRVVAVGRSGTTRVVAGVSFGFAGDNGPASLASLWHPQGVVADAHGNVFVADTDNDRLREIHA